MEYNCITSHTPSRNEWANKQSLKETRSKIEPSFFYLTYFWQATHAHASKFSDPPSKQQGHDQQQWRTVAGEQTVAVKMAVSEEDPLHGHQARSQAMTMLLIRAILLNLRLLPSSR